MSLRSDFELPQGISLLSVDVFDTSVTRASGPPEGVYLWLGRQLARKALLTCTPEMFARARAQAEQAVWRREGGLDASVLISDFYFEVAKALRLDTSLIPALVTAELELEGRFLRPIPRIRELIEDARAGGARVVFTSDTYFPRWFIEDQLQKHGLLSHDMACYASSDVAVSKAGGGLFQLVTEAEGVASRSACHVGDNLYSDVVVPRRRGLAALEFRVGRLNRYEKALGEQMWGTQGMTAAMSGASRLARLHTPVERARDRAIRDVAAGVAAPMLVGYVLWVLQRAADEGLDRLYFVARDGQILVKIAKQLTQRLGLDIKVAYLHASRQSVNAAACFSASAEETAWIVRDLEDLTVDDLLARFGLGWDEVHEELGKAGISRSSEVGGGDVARAFEELVTNESLRASVLERASELREMVVRYLEQEGVLQGKAGIVDFGGVGSQMAALHQLLVRSGVRAPRLFLIGLDRPEDAGLPRPAIEPSWLDDLDVYLYDHRRGRGPMRERGFGTCVQMFCAADHGTVVGYRSDETGRIRPVHSVDVDDVIVDWGLPVLQRTVESFVDHLVLDEDVVDLRADVRFASTEVIGLFWSTPTYEEALAWGSFPFEGAEVASSSAMSLATRYSWGSVIRGTFDGTFPNLGWQHWFEGSLQLTSAPLRASLHAAVATYRWLEGDDRIGASVVRRVRRLLGRPDRSS